MSLFASVRSALSARPRLRRRLLLLGGLALAVWIGFLDSHSLFRRFAYHQEYQELARENEALRAEIEALEAELAAPLSAERVERIAREEYGMRRPGETVYLLDERE